MNYRKDHDRENLESNIENVTRSISYERMVLRILFLILMEIRDWRRVRKEIY